MNSTCFLRAGSASNSIKHTKFTVRDDLPALDMRILCQKRSRWKRINGGFFCSPLEHTPDTWWCGDTWYRRTLTPAYQLAVPTRFSLSILCTNVLSHPEWGLLQRDSKDIGQQNHPNSKGAVLSTWILLEAWVPLSQQSQNCEDARLWPLGGSKALWCCGSPSNEHLKMHRIYSPMRFGLSPRGLQTATFPVLPTLFIQDFPFLIVHIHWSHFPDANFKDSFHCWAPT